MDLTDADVQRLPEADRRKVDPPVQVEMATWSPGGRLDWWVPAAPGGVKVYNYLAWSIALIILFWPLGIAAITNATKVHPAWQLGNAAMAQEHSNKAKMFSMIATIIGTVWFFIWFIIDGWRLGLSLFGSEWRQVQA